LNHLLESQSVQDFLVKELERRVNVNARYSQRGFARNLGLSAGELSEVLRGKRKLGLKAALKISRAMGLNPAESKHLLHLSQFEKSRDWNIETRLMNDGPALTSSQVNEDVFHMVSEWYYFAILNLADTKDFIWNSAWISRRLGVGRVQAKTAMERLLRLGLIKRSNGKFKPNTDVILSTKGVSSEAIRQYHRQMLGKALDALNFQPVQERDISGVGFACNTDDVDAIRREIFEFQSKLSSKYGKGKSAEVYHLEMAFFRLTEGGSQREQ
jgi:uncharacterized protein (TIGR02147 family)